MEKEKIREIVEQLKAVKAEKEYSYQKIANLTEEMGDPVSLSTIKRVFTEDARKFRWDTIRPIATVLLGVGFETPAPEKTDPNLYYAEIEAFKSLVEAKGEMIADKDKSIDFLQAQLKRQQAYTAVLAAALVVSVVLAIVL
jgi:hypothetical protein